MNAVQPVRRHVAIASALTLALAYAAMGQVVVVTNFAEPLRATTDIGNNPNPAMPLSGAPEWSWAAQSFRTDAAAYPLIRIDIIGGNEAANPVVVAELRADSAGQIGALITTLSHSSFLGPPSPRTLTPDAPVTLDPDTTYWIILGSQAPGDGTLGWSYANGNASVGVGMIAAYASSPDSGLTWNYGTDNPYFIQVVAAKPTGTTCCPGDADGNGLVNFADITQVLNSWGVNCP